MINPKLYDLLKWVAMIFLPALVVLVAGAGVLLEWDNTDKAAGLIALIDTFLGSLLQLNSTKYKAIQNDPQNVDGYVTPTEPDPDTGIPGMRFTISRHPDDFLAQDVVKMKVGDVPRQLTYREPMQED